MFVASGFVLTYFSRKHRDAQGRDSNPDAKDSSPIGKEFFVRPEAILGTMYAIIAGFAFTEALREYDQYVTHIKLDPHLLKTAVNPISVLLMVFSKSTNVLFRLTAFFALAIPFYHGGTVTLLEGKEEKHKMLIFIMMFFLGIILYFIGTNVDHIYRFAVLVTMLMLVDCIWCCYMRGVLGDMNFAIEWIQLNSITAGFFVSFLLLPIDLQVQDSVYINLIFFIVLILRTVLDYRFGWSTVYSRAFPKKKYPL
jgi:hypothetical protein